MTSDQELARVRRTLATEAMRWVSQLRRLDPDIARKVDQFMTHGDYEDQMSTRLIQNRAYLQELEERHGPTK
jgi:hypothetical protein